MSTDQHGNIHAGDGRFAGHQRTAPANDLADPEDGLSAYATVPVDGVVAVDIDGENQRCECGNDSYVEDWVAADEAGRIRPDSQGSSNPAEYTICPRCGRVYRNADLFDAAGTTTAAAARYDTADPAFIAELDQYNQEIYGG